MRRFVSLLLTLTGSLAGLLGTAAVAQAPAENRWYVYRDADSRENHGVWTNWMPAESAAMLKLNMVDGKNPNSGATCIRVDVRWQPPFWAKRRNVRGEPGTSVMPGPPQTAGRFAFIIWLDCADFWNYLTRNQRRQNRTPPE